MLLIPCPWCGPREENEYRYGGQAGIRHPTDPGALDDTAWADYLFMRDSPAGWFRERWYHAAGCRRWFDLTRDTRTDAIREGDGRREPGESRETSQAPDIEEVPR